MQESNEKGEVAFFIDWENIKFSLKNRNLTPNISELREEAESHGRVVIARAYADWENDVHRGDSTKLYTAGIEPVYVPTYYDGVMARRKNSVDIKLTVDCIEVCHRYANLTTFVLASGDADFIHVINALRPYGKKVVVVGVSWSTSSRLAERVDELVYIDKDSEPARPAQPRSLSVADVREVFDILVDIVREYRQTQRVPLLTWLRVELNRRVPRFDHRRYGYMRFKQFVQAAAQQGRLQIVTRGLVDWVLLPGEEVPMESSDTSGEEAAAGSVEESPVEETVADLEPAVPDEEEEEEEEEESVMPVEAQQASNPEALAEIIRLAQKYQKTKRFVTFRYLRDAACRSDLGSQLESDQIADLIGYAIQSGALLRGYRRYFDYSTGEVKSARTIYLNLKDERVRAALEQADQAEQKQAEEGEQAEQVEQAVSVEEA
ncbi:MAG: NYN domain-containing protein [Chloroflexota bacterium]|nr:MAG: NYN domain-containing protein [Chloroflexota bacterium]